MSLRTAAALALVVAGIALGAPGVSLVGILALLVVGLGRATAALGLRGVTYERRLGRDRMVWGDEIPLDLVIWNGKLLPLALLVAEDVVSEGVVVRDQELVAAERPGWFAVRNAWTLAWYERVVRHRRLVGDRRGRFVLGPTRITVADVFGREAATMTIDREQAYVVRPRAVPVSDRGEARAPLGRRRAPAGIFEEPTLFAGIRPYRAGDPPRRIHWRASARVGAPVSKRFESPRAREALIALDVQTVDGPHWRRDVDEELREQVAVAAASLARTLIGDGVATGLAAVAFTGTRSRVAWLEPRSGARQLSLIADALGRMGPGASAPFDHVLVAAPRRLPPGTSIVVVTGRDPSPILGTLRRLGAAGYEVRLILLGPRATASAAKARRVGVSAASAALDPDWRTADMLTLAG